MNKTKSLMILNNKKKMNDKNTLAFNPPTSQDMREIKSPTNKK
jgi:hypothetical protein